MKQVVVALLLAACTGEIPSGGGGSNSGDGGTKMDAAGSGGPHWVDAATGTGSNGLPCKNPVLNPGDGHHNPGVACMNCGHHSSYTVAGTLYTNATGNTAYAGATVTITDANGQMMDLTTLSNGNFFTTAAVKFPVTVIASACPSAVKMNANVSNGACNASGCHPGNTNNQMHLP